MENKNQPSIEKLKFVHDHKNVKLDDLIFLDKKTTLPQNSTIIFLKKFIRNKIAMTGLILLLAFMGLAYFMPLFFTDYKTTNMDIKNAAFSAEHIFGTDSYGRDLWTRIWFGLRFSINLALVATLIDIVVGVFIGITMGYSRRADRFFMFIIKVMTNVPSILILILLVIVIKPSFGVVVFSLTVTGWTGMSIQVRAQVLRLNSSDWVLASKTLGVKERKIISSFVPVIIPIIITQLVFTIPGVILSEAALGFIGLSIPNIPTLGNIIAESQTNFGAYPSHLIIPSVILVSIVISIQLVGNGVQEIMKSTR